MMKHGLLVTFFGKMQDRFCLYQQPMSLLDKLEQAARIPGVTGVELIYPNECLEDLDLQSALKRLRLVPAAINVNIKGDTSFVAGALSSPDEEIRRKAVQFIVEAKEFASRLGCERVTCAPLADGFDHPFQVHYESAWRRIVGCLREAADAIPEVTLHLEHKPAEPRTRGFLDSAAKVVRLCHDVDRPGIGITFNVGHSLFEGGSPAQEFAIVLDANRPCYVHYNDGTVNWDWDLMAGSNRLWQLIEFLFYAKEAGYDGWFVADTMPLRQDAVDVFTSNIRVTNRIWEWLDSADSLALRESLHRNDPLAGLEGIAKWIFQN
jgi:xylose isomerase